VKKILEKFNLATCKPRSISLLVRTFLLTNDLPIDEKKIAKMKKISYHETLGLLIWLQVNIWSNLLFVINLLSHFASKSGYIHWKAIKYMLVYMKGILEYGITYYKKVSLQLVSFVNLDFVNNKNTWKLTKVYIFYTGESPISWATKRQETIVTLIIEAKYIIVLHIV